MARLGGAHLTVWPLTAFRGTLPWWGQSKSEKFQKGLKCRVWPDNATRRVFFFFFWSELLSVGVSEFLSFPHQMKNGIYDEWLLNKVIWTHSF